MATALEIKPPPARRRWSELAILVGFVLLVAIPLMRWLPAQEAARWQAARAVEVYLDGAPLPAIEQLNEAVEQLPGDLSLHLRLAEWLIRHGEPLKADRKLDEVLEKVQPLAESSLTHANLLLRTLSLKAGALWMQDFHEVALDTIKKRQDMIRQNTDQQNLDLINELTYFRALTGLELEEGLDGAGQLLGTRVFTVDPQRNYSAHTRMAAVIATALIEYRLGRNDFAAEILDREIDVAQVEYNTVLQDLQMRLYLPLAASGLPIPSEAREFPEKRRQQLSRIGFDWAVLLTVRAYGHEMRGNTAAALADRQQVAQLGFSSSQLLHQMPSDLDLMFYLQTCLQYLDTVGYFQYRAGQGVAGLRDLDIAIAGAEVYVSTFGTELQNLPELSFDLRQQEADSKYLRAVLYQHRWQVHQSIGNRGLAAKDAAKLKELGFSVYDRLF